MEGLIAEKILFLNQKWENASKNSLADHIEDFLFQKYPDSRNSFNLKLKLLSELTNSKTDAAYAWINRGRNNVKIPFLKLCTLSVALNRNLEDFFD